MQMSAVGELQRTPFAVTPLDVPVQAGQAYTCCGCGRCADQPWAQSTCGDPVKFMPTKSGTARMCLCKQSSSFPLADNPSDLDAPCLCCRPLPPAIQAYVRRSLERSYHWRRQYEAAAASLLTQSAADHKPPGVRENAVLVAAAGGCEQCEKLQQRLDILDRKGSAARRPEQQQRQEQEQQITCLQLKCEKLNDDMLHLAESEKQVRGQRRLLAGAMFVALLAGVVFSVRR